MIKLILILCRNPDSNQPDFKRKAANATFLIAALPVALYSLTYQLAQSDWLYTALEWFYGLAAIEWTLSLKPYHLSAAEELVANGYHKLAVQYYALTAANISLLVILCVDVALTLWILGYPSDVMRSKKILRGSLLVIVWMLSMVTAFLFAGGNDFNPSGSGLYARFFARLGSTFTRPSPSGELALGDDWLVWVSTAWFAMVAVLYVYVFCREVARRRRQA